MRRLIIALAQARPAEPVPGVRQPVSHNAVTLVECEEGVYLVSV
jgi:hypothetical protein